MDTEGLIAFLDDSEELLQAVSSALVELERQPGDAETIGAILRGVHDIKGNAPLFGLTSVKRLAHQVEELMIAVRAGHLHAGREQISALLGAVDLLARMLQRLRSGGAELGAEDGPTLQMALVRLERARASEGPQSGWARVWRDLEQLARAPSTERCTQGVAELCQALAAVAAAAGEQPPPPSLAALAVPDALDELEAILRQSFEDELPPELVARVGALLQSSVSAADGLEARALTEACAEYRAMMEAVGFVPLLRETLLERVKEARDHRQRETSSWLAAAPAELSELEPAMLPPPPAGAAGPSVTPASAVSSLEVPHGPRTMRVDERKIDEFLDHVGELIITREMLSNVGKRLRLLEPSGRISMEFQRAMGSFTALSHDLQRSIMGIRKVPVQVVLQKVPRLARDLAEALGKQIDVRLSGGAVSVDKSLIEAIETPLVHMVRNAVDHGIELPEQRRAAGKPVVGQLSIHIEETAAHVLCRVRDDGAGVDTAGLIQRAVRAGHLDGPAAAALSPEQALQLIFVAGLTTARRVTEVSGRGVGMDVVCRNIASLRGRVDVTSTLGQGTTLVLQLPKAVTVQILDGFLVQVGQERLVLPLDAISESFRPTPEQLHTVAERGECVSRRGRVLPLLRVNRLLGLGTPDRSPSDAIVVSVEVPGGRSAGLLVDQVLGVQQVVLREVAGIDSSARVFSGGAVLGDGRVAMVVDVTGLGAMVASSASA